MGLTINGAADHFPYLFLFAYLLFAFHCTSTSADQRTIYIVNMDTDSMPKVFTSPHSWFSAITASLTSTNATSLNSHQSSPLLLYVHHEHALVGFSASLSIHELETLKKSPGYMSAYVDRKVTLLTTYTPEFMFLNPISGLWPASNYGEDVLIGVIDSGIWPESASFKSTGIASEIPKKWKGTCQVGEDFNSSMCNAKLIGARYFNKGLMNHHPGIKIRMNSARDTMGHGTFVSSIASGNYVNGASFFGYASGIAKGVAPKARLAIYKTNWEEGAYSSDIVTAIYQAISDGVDIISLSVGKVTRFLDTDAWATPTFSAMKKGILVSAAAGHIYPGAESIVNGYPWVLTVTASTTDRWFSGILDLGEGFQIVGWTLYPGVLKVSMPLVYDENLPTCDKILSKAPSGIIICFMDGGKIGGDLQSQVDNLARAKVEGAVIIVNTSGLVEMDSVDSIDCACILINPNDGDRLLQYLEATPSKPLQASMIFGRTYVGMQGTPTVARYAATGPFGSCPCILKPDVMAPGSLVLGAWPPNIPLRDQSVNQSFNNFNICSGTSVACPHASGVAALLKGAHSEWSPAAIKSAIITTAIPFDNTYNPIRHNRNSLRAASPLAMGAGQINPNKALDPGLIYDASPQDYVNLLCSMNFDVAQIVKITGSKEYNCSNPSSDLNYPSFLVLYLTRNVRIERKFRRTVTNVGQDVVTYKAKVAVPRGVEIVVSPQILEFTKKNQEMIYTLSISFIANEKVNLIAGELVWIEENGNHRSVRSPIVIAFDVDQISRGLCG